MSERKRSYEFRKRSFGSAAQRSPSTSTRRAVSVQQINSIIDADTSDEEDSPRRYCICRNTDATGFMICCDGCEEWFHGTCINITKNEAKNIQNYYCRKCRIPNQQITDTDKQSENKIQRAAFKTANKAIAPSHRLRIKKRYQEEYREHPCTADSMPEMPSTSNGRTMSKYSCGICNGCRKPSCGKCNACLQQPPVMPCIHRVCLLQGNFVFKCSPNSSSNTANKPSLLRPYSSAANEMKKTKYRY